jgi:hypothetical protein
MRVLGVEVVVRLIVGDGVARRAVVLAAATATATLTHGVFARRGGAGA